MQGGRGGGDPFFNFGDPFGSFGGVAFPGMGGHRSFMSSFFGGNNPFDDPFFNSPFGGMFDSPFGLDPFRSMRSSMSFIDDQPFEPKRSRGPVIEELNSDDEENQNTEENPKRHCRLNRDPQVKLPDEEGNHDNHGRQVWQSNNLNRFNQIGSQNGPRVVSFQSSSVTYGGPNGAYYSSSSTRRTGSDGIMLEESKEADTTTRQATHRVSKGLHSKGHSVTRKLGADGRVNTTQTLHNLNEDEVTGFEEKWNGKAQTQLPWWSENYGSIMNREHAALPSTEVRDPAGPSNFQQPMSRGYNGNKGKGGHKGRG